MVGGANYHKSQFNLATQGERQPGSSFKPFVLATALRRTSRRPRSSSSKHVTINIGGGSGRSTTTRARRSARSTSRRRSRTPTTRCSPSSPRSSGPERRCDRAPARDHVEAQRVLRDRARRRAGDAARDGARVRIVRRRRRSASTARSSGTSPARSRRSTSDGKRHVDEPVARRRPQLRPGRDGQPAPAGRRPVRDRHGRRRCPGWQVAGKTGTTENYGDAWFVGYTPQTRRRRLGRLPDKLVPMTYRVPRAPGRRRHVPGADLEGVHGEGDPVPEAAAGAVRVAAFAVRVGGHRREPRRRAAARRRRLQEHVQLAFFGGEPPGRGPAATASRTKWRSPTSSAGRSPTRGRGSQGQPLTPTVVYKPAKTGDRVGFVVGQFPRARDASAYDKITLIAESRCTASCRVSSACRSHARRQSSRGCT